MPPDRHFVEKLQSGLDLVLFVQRLRCHKYGAQDAEEWPIGHTPPELKQRVEDEHRRYQALLDLPTPSDSGDVDDMDVSAHPQGLNSERGQLHLGLGQQPRSLDTSASSSEGRSLPSSLAESRKNFAQPPQSFHLSQGGQPKPCDDRQIGSPHTTSSLYRNGNAEASKYPKKRRFSEVETLHVDNEPYCLQRRRSTSAH